MHKIPFLRIAVAMAAGIVCHEFCHLPISWVIGFVSVTFLSTLLFAFLFSKTQRIAYNQWLGIGILGCLFFTAYLHADTFHPVKPDWPEQQTIMRVKLSGFPMEREKTYRVEAEMLEYERNDTVRNNGGNILLYFSKEIACKNWQPDDELIIAAKPTEITGPMNPGEFDLAAYNAKKGIYYRAFVQPKQVLEHKESHSFGVKKWFYKARKYLMSLSEERFSSPSEKALSDALVFGYQDDLDEETVGRFSKSGTSHVLAVSGLHIGILWAVVDWLLSFLNRRKSLRIVKFILSLSVLWGYALLTGLSPSVMRAAIMFTGFAAAGAMKQRYISLNVLFVSAAAQMILEPMVIFNIGFQLSYSAVASILIFYPPIKNTLYFKKKYQRLIWESVALTLAAQILTTPISLYWFGQFPVWFIFSNLILVPLSSLALMLGLISFAFVWLPYVSDLLFLLFSLSIKLMDTIAAFFAELPYALLYFNPDGWDIIGLYLIIIFITLFLEKKTVTWFKAILVVGCLFLGAGLVKMLVLPMKEQWIVYQLKQGTVLRYFHENKVDEYRSELADKKSYSYSVKPSDRLFDVKERSAVSAHNSFLSIGNKNIVLLQKEHLENRLSSPIVCDWIIIESLKFIDFDALQANFTFQKLIIGSGNSWKSKQFWHKECAKRNITVHDLTQEGAMVVEAIRPSF